MLGDLKSSKPKGGLLGDKNQQNPRVTLGDVKSSKPKGGTLGDKPCKTQGGTLGGGKIFQT